MTYWKRIRPEREDQFLQPKPFMEELRIHLLAAKEGIAPEVYMYNDLEETIYMEKLNGGTLHETIICETNSYQWHIDNEDKVSERTLNFIKACKRDFEDYYFYEYPMEKIIAAAKAVKALHNLRIIHGDLHTKNIMFNEEGKAYIIDFEFSYICENEEKFEEAKKVDIYHLTTSFNPYQKNIFMEVYDNS